MSVFTHGVDIKGKPSMIIRNKVFAVADSDKTPEQDRASGTTPYGKAGSTAITL
jgi:hypothetical protein